MRRNLRLSRSIKDAKRLPPEGMHIWCEARSSHSTVDNRCLLFKSSVAMGNVFMAGRFRDHEKVKFFTNYSSMMLKNGSILNILRACDILQKCSYDGLVSFHSLTIKCYQYE